MAEQPLDLGFAAAVLAAAAAAGGATVQAAGTGNGNGRGRSLRKTAAGGTVADAMEFLAGAAVEVHYYC